MRMLLVVIGLFIGSQSLAGQLNCTPPEGYTGEAATMNGTFEASENGLKGTVEIKIGLPEQPPRIHLAAIPVEGYLLDPSTVILRPTQKSPLSTILMSYVTQSYIEHEGTPYKTTCQF